MGNSISTQDRQSSYLSVVGSTARSDYSPRLFKIDVPALDCFFSGTGDMFAALTVARLREAVFTTDSQARENISATPARLLCETQSWVSPDCVPATQLPLAKATTKVLGSMHRILEKTMEARDEELARYKREDADSTFSELPELERKAAYEKREYLRQTKAAEVKLVRNIDLLREPPVEFKAEEWSTSHTTASSGDARR